MCVCVYIYIYIYIHNSGSRTSPLRTLVHREAPIVMYTYILLFFNIILVQVFGTLFQYLLVQVFGTHRITTNAHLFIILTSI